MTDQEYIHLKQQQKKRSRKLKKDREHWIEVENNIRIKEKKMEESKMGIEERVSLLKAMNTIMLNENDEDIINIWFDLDVPDNASEEDYESIAEDDEAFIDICKEFMIFMRNKDNELFLGKIGENFEVV